MPLLEGARLTTGEDGQAEVEFEDGSIVRLTPNTSLGITALTVDAAGDFHTSLTVLRGLVYTELRAAPKFTYQIDAGGELISPVANATIRINLDQPPATVAVFDGTVHVEHASSPEADGYKTNVHAGEMLTGDASDSSRYFLLPNIEQDSWDEWNHDRDAAAAEAAADRTTARDGFAGDQGYGWSDLDANGSWYDVPGQGQVWQPAMAQDADFDPYGYGSWVSYPGSGYVWASGYSWGWTPFRCGNWSYWNSFGWGWSPTGCGVAGWGFGGGGGIIYVVNILHPPVNYRLPTRPIRRAGMGHSIPVGHVPKEPGTAVRPSQEPRMIAGVSVEPLHPIGSTSSLKNSNVVGAALRSDFAVDHASRQPVLGTPGAASVAAPRGDFRQITPRPAAGNGAEQPALSTRQTPPQRAPYPSHTSDGEHSASRPYTPAYAPRSSPPPAPRSAPPPPASHPAATTTTTTPR